MKDDQFTQLFKYMAQRFDAVELKLDAKADKNDADRIYNVIDSFAKQQEIEEHERLAISRQVSRHEQWHGQIAQKLNIHLNHVDYRIQEACMCFGTNPSQQIQNLLYCIPVTVAIAIMAA